VSYAVAFAAAGGLVLLGAGIVFLTERRTDATPLAR